MLQKKTSQEGFNGNKTYIFYCMTQKCSFTTEAWVSVFTDRCSIETTVEKLSLKSESYKTSLKCLCCVKVWTWTCVKLNKGVTTHFI